MHVGLAEETLHRALSELDERAQKVLRLRYGLDGDPPMTLQQVGERMGVTRERIRQIESHALEMLARSREMEAFSEVA